MANSIYDFKCNIYVRKDLVCWQVQCTMYDDGTARIFFMDDDYEDHIELTYPEFVSSLMAGKIWDIRK